MYRGPDKAYSSMDFYGTGFITEETFLNAIFMRRIPYSPEEVKEFLVEANLFNNNDTKGGMAFDQFKKTFFP